MSERKEWKGVVICLQIPDNALLSNPDDRDPDQNPSGEHEFEVEAHCKADAYEAALDQFHRTVPVGCMDDFEFLVRFEGDAKPYDPEDEDKYLGPNADVDRKDPHYFYKKHRLGTLDDLAPILTDDRGTVTRDDLVDAVEDMDPGSVFNMLIGPMLDGFEDLVRDHKRKEQS